MREKGKSIIMVYRPEELSTTELRRYLERAIQTSKEFIEWHKKAIADYEESIKLNQECLDKHYSVTL